MKKQATLLILTAVFYSLAGSLLYRQRVISADRLWNSDWLVFAAPMLVAFVTFAWALWPPRSPSSASLLRVLVAILQMLSLARQSSYFSETVRRETNW